MKVVPTGLALSLFLAITFVFIAGLHLLTHGDLPMGVDGMMGDGMSDMARRHGAGGFLIGLAVAYALGWYTALVYVPLHNLFNRKRAA